MTKIGLYDTEKEHSSCGTGFVVDTKNIGQPSHNIVAFGLKALSCNVHRGATVDGETGDGAGVLTQIPVKYLNGLMAEKDANPNDRYFGVGMMFMPTNAAKRARAKKDIETVLDAFGFPPLMWRDVPSNNSVMSKTALAVKPHIEQVIFAKTSGMKEEDFEKLIYRASCAIQHKALTGDTGLFIASMSGRTIVHKGLFRADQVGDFYTDLQDPDFESQFAIYHSRFSTNTKSTWQGAQPFGNIAHNGEINTIQSNQINWISRMIAEGEVNFNFVPGLSDSGRFNAVLREYVYGKGYSVPQALIAMMPPAWQNDPRIEGEVRSMLQYFSLYQEPFDGPAHMIFTDGKVVGARLDRGGLRPSRTTLFKNGIIAVGSETGVMPFGVDEVLRHDSLRAGQMVAVDITTGRYWDSSKGLLEEIAAQGTPESRAPYSIINSKIMHKIPDALEIDGSLRKGPSNFTPVALALDNTAAQAAYGWNNELSQLYVLPMASEAKEKLIAMGDDTPPAVLSPNKWPLSYYAKQRFAQVTNPPIDPLREADNLSILLTLGGRLSPETSSLQRVKITSPVLMPGVVERIEKETILSPVRLNMTFETAKGREGMEAAIQALCTAAKEQVRAGKRIIILDDSGISETHGAMDIMLATAAVNQHLIDRGLRTKASIIVNSGQVVSTHDLNMALSCGAAAVCPFMLYNEVANQYAIDPGKAEKDRKFANVTLNTAMENTARALEAGIKKTMTKMGICDVESYIGGMQLEFLGIDVDPKKESLLANVFKNVESPIGGHGIEELTENALSFHTQATKTLSKGESRLPDHGKFDRKSTHKQEPRGWDKVIVVKGGQAAAGADQKDRTKPRYEIGGIGEGDEVLLTEPNSGPIARAYATYIHETAGERIYQIGAPRKDGVVGVVDLANTDAALSERIRELKPYTPEEINAHSIDDAYRKLRTALEQSQADRPTSLGAMLNLRKVAAGSEVPLQEVQSADTILKQFTFGGMSLGALTDPAHASVALAGHLTGIRSNTGEGGEPKERWGTPLNGPIKQMASGRFGVSAEYLKNADEIEIKVAQGAKPGEGGQLGAPKVTLKIAMRRGGTPGVELISPPPHHDIYSIEDLAELIYDIRSANPRISVKLVSSTGVGTIGVGVAKALLAKGLDVDGLAGTISIAGGTGGTGAAQITSIYHAGMPFETGLSEVHQALRSNGLEDLVHLRTSGAFKTGSDIVKAAILGADEFEFGTVAMIMLKCIMAGTCNTNCPVGVTTNGEKFTGNPEDLAKYMLHVAHDVRETLSQMGLKSLEEARGRTELLERVEFKNPDIRDSSIDLERMLERPQKQTLYPQVRAKMTAAPRYEEKLLSEVLNFVSGTDAAVTVDGGELRNCDRSVGGRIAVELCDRLSADAINGRKAVAKDAVNINFTGIAGQSFGVFNVHGMQLSLAGEAQDGVGKSMSGGVIALSPPEVLKNRASENTIAGNVCLFGATGGEAYIAGRAGDRFAVRNSGATAIVEGVGDYGCEYMTSGTVINIGRFGKKFGAGMSGGIVMQYDPEGVFSSVCDHSAVSLYKGEAVERYYEGARQLLTEHVARTGSAFAAELLADWDQEKHNFVVMIPKQLELIQTKEGVANIETAYKIRQPSPVEALMIGDLAGAVGAGRSLLPKTAQIIPPNIRTISDGAQRLA